MKIHTISGVQGQGVLQCIAEQGLQQSLSITGTSCMREEKRKWPSQVKTSIVSSSDSESIPTETRDGKKMEAITRGVLNLYDSKIQLTRKLQLFLFTKTSSIHSTLEWQRILGLVGEDPSCCFRTPGGLFSAGRALPDLDCQTWWREHSSWKNASCAPEEKSQATTISKSKFNALFLSFC